MPKNRGTIHFYIQFNSGLYVFFWFLPASVICNTLLFIQVDLVSVLNQALNIFCLFGGVEIVRNLRPKGVVLTRSCRINVLL